jgi:YVTN family beta-propeller protein
MHLAPCVIVDASIVAPVAIAQLPGGGEIYVANQGSNQATVIDPATLAVKTTVSVGSSSSAIVASPDGNCVYVADGLGGSNVRVINTSGSPTKTVTQTIAVGGGPSFLRFDPPRQRVYVANSAGVSVIANSADCNSSVLSPPIAGTGGALSVTALADGSRAYAALSNGNVVVIDTGSNTVRKTISGQGVLSMKASIGSSADSTRVYVANDGRPAGGVGKVFVIRTSDDTVILPPATGFMPTGSGTIPQFVLMNP